MKSIFLSGVLFLTGLFIFGQSHFEPNYALKTPQTLEIINIDLQKDATILKLSIENMVEGGYFCIDKETYITTDAGVKYKLSKLTGLPHCPGQYKFKRVGEIVYVTMSFPPVPGTTQWMDLIEECGEGCLAVYGICLDRRINSEINICFRDMEKGRNADAIKRFESLKSELKDSNNPILGSIYLNLISLYKVTGNQNMSTQLINEFQGIIIPHKELFLKSLNQL
ncbi:MAG: hypothetical protein QNK33_05990 [Bacteroidales bacterium]|nr:hypothetical protein [Bacteroidales bacterium]